MRADHIVSREGKCQASTGAFSSIRKTRVANTAAALRKTRSAKCEAFCIHPIAAALGVQPPYLHSEQRHCTSTRDVVNTYAATFWHFWSSGPARPLHTFNYCKSRYREPGFQKFQKIDLTTIFANVKCPAIGDRIVSVRLRGGALGGRIQRTISHSSFPAFSVLLGSGMRSGR
jgi:hypothetical protein